MDMDRSVHFYRDLLGMKLLYDAERENIPAYVKIIGYKDVKIRIAGLEDGRGIMICLMQYRNPPMRARSQENFQQGAAGIAFEVEDVDADYARLTAAGVESRSEPVVIVRDGKPVAKACYMHDPDGVTVEIYQPMK
jgi:catechol 2,3-dioxygenase-like lactoylglutathione lyase family enzyme